MSEKRKVTKPADNTSSSSLKNAAEIIRESKGVLKLLPTGFRPAVFFFACIVAIIFAVLFVAEITAEKTSLIKFLVFVSIFFVVIMLIYKDVISILKFRLMSPGGTELSSTQVKVAAISAQDVKEVSVTSVPQPVDKSQFSHYLEEYRTYLISQCAEMPLQRLVEIDIRDENTLDSLYVPLEAQETAREEDPQKFRRQVIEGDYSQTVAVLQLAERENRWVLLGEPGAGKSTFARHLARAMADRSSSLPRDLRACFPIFIELRGLIRFWPEDTRLANMAAFWQALEKDFSDNHGFPKEQARLTAEALRAESNQNQLWILDGLDEVTASAGRRESLCRTIEQLATSGRRHVLVTARPYAYAEKEWRLQNFAVYALAPFKEAQWTQFITQYYQGLQKSYGLNVQEAERLAQRLTDDLGTSQYPHLLQLAERPLLLTLLTHQHAKGRGSLPDNRAELYEKSIEQLLVKWQQARIEVFRENLQTTEEPEERRMLDLLDTDLPTLRERLQELAFDCHKQQQQGKRGDDTADIARRDLLAMFAELIDKVYKPSLIVNYLEKQTSLLYARDNNTFAFAHRTFQEYLAACHLMDSGALDDRDGLLEVVSDLPWWREVVLLAVGKARAGGAAAALNTIEQLLPYSVGESGTESGHGPRDGYAALLAGHALNEQSRQGDIAKRPQFIRLQKRSIDWLNRMLTRELFSPPLRGEAGDVLGQLGDPRPGVGLVDTPVGQIPQLALVYIPGTAECGLEEGFSLGYTAEEMRRWDKGKYGFEPGKNEHWPEKESRLTLRGFWIAAYPVTVAQFEPFVHEGYQNDDFWTKAGQQWRNKEASSGYIFWQHQGDYRNRPITIVNWYEAVAYCNWLTARLHDTGCRNINIRLPSEREWEWAARGPDRLNYPWGDECEDGRTNTAEIGIRHACAVGSFPKGTNWVSQKDIPPPHKLPLPFVQFASAYDLTGNMWEWCSTKWQESYENYDRRESEWDGNYLRGEGVRVFRGNSYSDNSLAARGALRDGSHPGGGSFGRGFRCCAHVFPNSDS